MPRSARLARGVAACALAVAAACASSTTRAGGAAPGRDANLLTTEEIEGRGAGEGSLYDAIRRLRPSFLTFHGVSGTPRQAGRVQVSLDGGALTGVEALRGVPVRQVAEVRYLSATDAAQRFGTSANSSPVILVRQK